ALLACADATSPVAVPSVSLRPSGALFSTTAGNDHDNDYAHAIHVRITNMAFNTTIVDQYSFNAMQHKDSVKGEFRFYQIRIIAGVEEAVVIASGPIVCLDVTGNRARVGGRVESTTFPEGIPVGSEVTWSVT